MSQNGFFSDRDMAFAKVLMDGNIVLTRIFLERGVCPNELLPFLDGHKEPCFYPPLLVAVIRQNLAMVDLLLKHGANPNLSSDTGMTPLMVAADLNNHEIMKRLVSKGASIFKTEDNFGMTAGDFAKDEEALYILMQAGLEECGIPKAKAHSLLFGREVEKQQKQKVRE